MDLSQVVCLGEIMIGRVWCQGDGVGAESLLRDAVDGVLLVHI